MERSVDGAEAVLKLRSLVSNGDFDDAPPAQEVQLVWTAHKRDTDPAKASQFMFSKQQRRVIVYYVYVRDMDFGGRSSNLLLPLR